MLQLRSVLLASLILCGLATSAHAVVISSGQNITATGQVLNFSEAAPSSDGGAGSLIIVLNGDFTDGFSAFEGAAIAIDLAGGSLSLENDGGAVVASNSIAGLDLRFSSRTVSASDDVGLTYSFGVSSSLLALILSDNLFTMTVDLYDNVNPLNRVNEDFVSFALIYNEAMAVIPLPASLPLLAGGLLILGYAGIGRKRAKA